MPTNTLSDSKCKSAKPKEKDYKLFDGGGLFLWVSSKGNKTWRIAYRVDGKPKTMAIGPYPDVSLADARIKRDELKASLRDGKDPMEKKHKQKNMLTFAEATQEYWRLRNDVSPSYKHKALRSVELHVFPDLGSMPINKITREDLLNSLRVADAKGIHDHVRKIKIWCSQVFDWAMENSYCEINPASMIKSEKAFGKNKVENMAALKIEEVPEFLERLSFEDQNMTSVLACKALANTWVRTKELRFMEWTEVQGALWVIPADKMKRNRDHVVPLSKQMLAILRAMKARSRGGKYVFESDISKEKPISENAILYLLYRIGYKGRMTGHGWRSIASTWANENRYNPDAIEMQLSHVSANKVRSAYNRAEYLPERKKMVQDWADWLDSLNNK